MNAAEVQELTSYLTKAEREELDALLADDLASVAWRPLPGPQSVAYFSDADVIGFGGAAGGGKTDLACGKALTQHERIAIFRREGTELTAVIDRLVELVGHRDGYNGQERIWRMPNRQIELCSVPNLGDERKYQGRPKDLLVLDEAANMLEAQVRFLMGWVRSTTPGQKCQTLMTFNPPTNAEGRWIVSFFAPWIDKRFVGKRALPGEIRYVGVVPGENGVSRDLWVDSPASFVIVDGQPCYDFDAKDYAPQDIVKPQSRTFIPSRISDNPFLMNTGYLTVLQALPEPLRSQMLMGDFEAGMDDDPWQVIPTAWIEAAQARWTDRSPKGEMISMGVDVARGGRDQSVIAKRHAGEWYDRLVKLPGKSTPDGQTLTGQVIAHRRDSAPIHLDVIGVGAAPYDLLRTAKQQVIGVNVAEAASTTDRSGRLRFANLRSELWWRLRETLDPINDTGIALPPDPELLADLAAPKWSMQGMRVKVESREDIVERIGRSPDCASAVILAQLDTPKMDVIKRQQRADNSAVLDYDPMAGM
ncbi:MAG: terminase [bacterium]